MSSAYCNIVCEFSVFGIKKVVCSLIQSRDSLFDLRFPHKSSLFSILWLFWPLLMFLLMQKLISISVLFKCVSWPVYGPARAFPHFVVKLVPLLTLHTRTLSVKLRTHHGVETGQGCFDLLPQYPFFFPQTAPEFQSPTQVRGQHW